MEARTRAAWAALFVALSGTGACDGPAPAGPEAVDRIEVTPTDTTLTPGDTVRLRAVAFGAEGTPIEGIRLTWAGGTAGIAILSGEGLVTAVGSGSTVVRVTAGGVEGRAEVSVEGPEPVPGPGPVASVELSPTLVSLEEGGEIAFHAVPRDAGGSEVPGRVVVWTSRDPAVATVDALGRVTAVKAGHTRITARVDGVVAASDVTVATPYGFDLLYDLAETVGVAPQLYRTAIGDPDAVPTRLFPADRRAMDAAVSPDGTRVAFVVLVEGGSDIWVADPDGAAALRITGSPGFHDKPTWSPDGTRIAYRSWNLAAGEDADLWVVEADGSNPINLTDDHGLSGEDAPAWSPGGPNGSRIAYTRIADGMAHLWTMDADGGNKTQVTTGPVADMSPSWSPDGNLLVFERYGETGSGDLFLVHPSGGETRILTAMPFGQFDPAFSPDGRLVAFTSQVDGVRQIFTVWADGSKRAQRTSGEKHHDRPTWMVRAGN